MIVTFRQTICNAMKEPRTVAEIAEATRLDKRKVQINVSTMMRQQKYNIERTEENGVVRYQFKGTNKIKRKHIYLEGSRYKDKSELAGQ